jgi:hypothetical protein
VEGPLAVGTQPNALRLAVNTPLQIPHTSSNIPRREEESVEGPLAVGTQPNALRLAVNTPLQIPHTSSNISSVDSQNGVPALAGPTPPTIPGAATIAANAPPSQLPQPPVAIQNPPLATPAAEEYTPPLEPTDVLARLPSGDLPNGWNAVDALHLDMVLVSPFRHLTLVPAAAMSDWKDAYTLAAEHLIAAINSPLSASKQIEIRRALMWYAALPALLLRKTGQTSKREVNTVRRRCIDFINGHYGSLINHWEQDYRKAILKTMNRPIDSEAKRIKRAISLVKRSLPHSISRAVSLMTGHGCSTCDDNTVRDQMRLKHPSSDATWSQHIPAPHHSDQIKMKDLPSIIDSVDFNTAAGPRGLFPHHIYSLSRAITLTREADSAIKSFQTLGYLVLENACPWVSLVLGGTILTPIKKTSIDNDSRPVASKDRDNATWLQAATRAEVNAVRALVEPQQLAVGVPGGTQVKGWGLKLLLEEAKRNGSPVTLHKDDRVNAHNEFHRDSTVREIRLASENNPSLSLHNFARLADSVLRLRPQIYTRSNKRGVGIIPLCRSERGGEQGNATTNLLYPACMNAALKETEANFDVLIRAVQDDTTIFGRAEEIYGDGKAREHLTAGFLSRGNRIHLGKAKAYGSTPEERALIPPDVQQPFYPYLDNEGVEAFAYGIEVCGIPLGDKEYISSWLREKADEIAEKIRYVSTRAASVDPHSCNAINTYSLQSLCDYIMATNLPSETVAFARTVSEALEEAYSLSLGSNLLGPTLIPPIDAVTDSVFIRDRLKLRSSKGGGGIRILSDREHFLNSLCLVLPQLIDRTNDDGNVTKGLFPKLSTVLGAGSFDSVNSDNRWSPFLASGSEIAAEFASEFLKGKHIHMAATDSLTPQLQPRPASIYDTPLQGFGAGLKKVQKLIQDERQDLLFQLLTQRALALPTSDPRRMAFLANSKDPFATKLLGSLPHPDVRFDAREWTTAVALHLGVPIPALKAHVGSRIVNHPNCQQLTVDPHGYNLTTVTGLKGGGTIRNHNSIGMAISSCLVKAGIQHRGGGNDHGCKAIFRDATPAAPVQSQTDKTYINSIIVDLVLLCKSVEDTPLGGRDHLVDIKTLAGGACYKEPPVAVQSIFNGVVNKRQAEVNGTYHRTAATLDTRLHSTPQGTRGPFAEILSQYGIEGRVLGPVVGVFGEASSDLVSLRDLCVHEQERRYREWIRCPPSQSKGLFTHGISRLWGHSISRGWSRLILDRLRDSVGTDSLARRCATRAAGTDAHEAQRFHQGARRGAHRH